MPLGASPLSSPTPANDVASVDGCAVTRLTLTDFRCYPSLRLETEAGAVVLVGPNGAGKTNVLEAVSLLTPGRGLRGARLAEIARRGGDGGWAAAADVLGRMGAAKVGVGADPGQDGTTRKVHADGLPARGQSALAERFAALWLTPQMDGLFAGPAEERRRYLDRLAATFDPAHVGRVQSYRNAMRQRLGLLRDGPADKAWLEALEAEMAARAVAIAAARTDTAQRLDNAASEGETSFPRAAIRVDGMVEDWLGDGPALAAEDRLRACLAEDRPRDAAAGSTSAGPHRSDLAVSARANAMPAAEGSTGEQKALLVSLTFASARMLAGAVGVAPALLLDEVAAHFDPERRARLFDEALALGGQLWVTGADAAQLDGLAGRADWFRIEAAALRPTTH